MNFRRLFSRPVLLAAAAVVSLTVSGCQHPPKLGLTDYVHDQRESFFRSELSQIAPELADRELEQTSAQSRADSKSKLIYRSQFGVFFLDKEDHNQHKNRIFFVRMEGKPVNEGREVEVTVHTGHGGFVPVEQDPDRKPVMVAGFLPVTVTNGSVFKVLDEKFYRRQVTPLH